MATVHRNPPQLPTNGVITAPSKGVVGTNRKKAKRRAKQAAKAAQVQSAAVPAEQEVDYNEDPLGYDEEDDYEFSDTEQADYHEHYSPPHHQHHHGHHHGAVNGYDMSMPSTAKKNRRRKKKNGANGELHYETSSQLPELPSAPSMAVPPPRGSQQNIWNTSTQQERQNIKNFWLSLSEEERKSLLKIEKEAVLRKMKQQQKHSCSCTVCGRKRTAIEEELEVLYEGYYEELEQYAHHDHPPLPGHTAPHMPPPLGNRHPLAAPPPPTSPPHHTHHRSSQMLEHLDDEDDYSDEGEEYSDEEYSEDEPEPIRPPIQDFFNFGQNLTVKDNLLTVADDLLKNDGRKFIEMMEQLAERRMQRETEAEYAAANPSHPGDGYHPNDGYNGDVDPNDEYDDDEQSYDSQEYEDDELDDDDEMNGLSEEQRMQEGRRMFQIFAARMFEHRVLTAYKEKVAAERQQKLLEELEDEETLQAQREAKKKRDAEKKKDKKRQQQLAKAEEKAKKEAEKAAEEARLREAEEKKQEEQRRKKEEQRKKKEDEKRKLEEDRLKKEAERLRRQQEEQLRREEAERKLREQKSAEKAKKEEARKREKEEREAREKAARDRKAQEDEKRERELKAKAELEKSQDPAAPVVAKRPSHQNMIAVPGALSKQATSAVASPKPLIAVATKASSPSKRGSQQGSHASSPRQGQTQLPIKTSPSGNAPSQPPGFPKQILQKPQVPPQQMQGMSMMPQQMQPPPGMAHPQMTNGFPHLPPQGYPPNIMTGGMRSPMPMYPGPPMPMQNRISSFGAPGLNGMHGPPPGMMQGRSGYAFDNSNASSPNAPPGFGIHVGQGQTSSHASPIGPPQDSRTPHSRQQSVNDKFDLPIGTGMGRPAPIQRPSSVKPHEDQGDIDDLSKHLGSSALLDDDDDDSDQRPLGRRISQRGPLDNLGSFGSTVGSFGAPGTAWATPSPFSQSPGLGHQWGNMSPASSAPGWNNNSFAQNSGFGAIAGAASMHRPGLLHANRPLTIRIAVCQACKQLSSVSNGDDYHDVDILLRQIEQNRPPLDAPPSLKEIEDICETEGDAQNGGGELHVRKAPNGAVVAVRWQHDIVTPDLGRQNGHGSLGEIGSPLPAKSTPAIGFGAPGMGRSSISGWIH